MKHSTGEKVGAILFVLLISTCVYLFSVRVSSVSQYKSDEVQFEIDCNESKLHSIYECKALTKQAF